MHVTVPYWQIARIIAPARDVLEHPALALWLRISAAGYPSLLIPVITIILSQKKGFVGIRRTPLRTGLRLILQFYIARRTIDCGRARF